MASERQNMSDQEISIKAREHELYVQTGPTQIPKPVKPFPVYLRETPAEPLSPATKAILWMVGTVVVLLFLAALWRVTHSQPTRPATKTVQPESKTAMFSAPDISPESLGAPCGLSMHRTFRYRMVLKTILTGTYSKVCPTMTSSRIAVFGLVLASSLSLTFFKAAPSRAGSPAQDEPTGLKPKVLSPAGAGLTLQSINTEYARQLLELERQRLDRLGQLAARQSPALAAETYEQLLRLAIANNLFLEAEPAAQQVLKSTTSLPPTVQILARTIDIIASADRGAHEESLTELRNLLDTVSRQTRPGDAASASLDTSALLAICGAYQQRLLQGDHFDTAKKAFQMLIAEAKDPAVKEFSALRLAQLEMIGMPAPAIQGTDLDGKPFSLAEMKGSVVLVVFWASWCLPSAAEVATLDQVYTNYQNRGFRVIGINVDTVQTGGPKLETVLPNIRRFLLDNNVRWPNLINGSGSNNYAKAYGITEIPSNVLIGRDGTVIHLDLSPRKNLATVVAKAVGP